MVMFLFSSYRKFFDKMWPKRKPEINQPKMYYTAHMSYAVIETIEGDGDVFVQFIPRRWLRPVSKTKPIALRESAMYFYPIRLSNQDREEHIKFVKHAKLVLQQPKSDWELRHCRVLKLEIETFEGAIQAENLFSIYFNTTYAELHMHEPAPPKRMRKSKKKRNIKAITESESEDEDGPKSAQIRDIGNYNNAMVRTGNASPPNTINQNNFASDEMVDDNSSLDMEIPNALMPMSVPESSENNIEYPPVDDETTFVPLPDVVHVFNTSPVLGENNIESPPAVGESTFIPLPDVSTAGLNEVNNENQDVVIEFIDEQTSSSTNDKCKCLQKVMNKIDYFQKKVLKQLALNRQESAKAIREVSDRVDVLLSSENVQNKIPDAAATSREEFEVQFKEMFPIAVNKLLVDISDKIKSEKDFKEQLLLKLSQKTEEAAIKATRKILKLLCSSSYLSGFTWTGSSAGPTQKLSFSSLEPLIEVVTHVIEAQFPKCGAYAILKGVVQQRTKSAMEYESKKKESELQVINKQSTIQNQELDISEDSSIGLRTAEANSSNAKGLEDDQHQACNRDNE